MKQVFNPINIPNSFLILNLRKEVSEIIMWYYESLLKLWGKKYLWMNAILLHFSVNHLPLKKVQARTIP